MRAITGDAGLVGHCGMGFWTNSDGRYPKLPAIPITARVPAINC